MPQGKSGRVVVELGTSLKRELYSVLARENRTLKEWLTERATAYVAAARRPEASGRDRTREGGGTAR
ncbi:MAG: hypothetical protein OXC13_01490 [Caldilineaceae bacterium]|nr:hypothetical protein [Caldilineaceae bacterium]